MFLDSISFLPFALRKLSETFGLKVAKLPALFQIRVQTRTMLEIYQTYRIMG